MKMRPLFLPTHTMTKAMEIGSKQPKFSPDSQKTTLPPESLAHRTNEAFVTRKQKESSGKILEALHASGMTSNID